MRLLLIGNYGDKNLGDEALKDYFLKTFPEHQWTVLSANPKGPNEVERLAFGFRSFLTPWWKTLWAYFRSEAVVFGGGSLFTDTESPFACLLWWHHAFTAWFFQKPILLAFQGIGPFKTRIGEWCARWVVARAHFISVRDDASVERMRKWKHRAEVIETFDPVFSLKRNVERSAASGSYIALIPRKNSGQEFFAAVEEAGTGPFAIVSLQSGDPAEQVIITTLEDRLAESAKIVPVTTMEELMDVLSHASYVITERYHGAIPALALGIPVTVISQHDRDKLAELRSIAEAVEKNPSVLEHLTSRMRGGEQGLRKALAALEPRRWESTMTRMGVVQGTEAPAFSAPDQTGIVHSLEEERGSWVILYFYPKDDTPGCTKESCGFRDACSDLTEYASIFGVSSDDTESHARFAKKYSLPFPLLSDHEGKIRALYGADGSTYPKRTTFLIDPAGKIAKIYDSVDVENHAATILSDLRNLAS